MAKIDIISGVDFSANNVGWVGTHFPSLGGALVWAGALGSGWERPSPEVYDYSLQNRPGMIVGAPALEGPWALVDHGNYASTPITDTQLMAEGTANQFTLVAVTRGSPATGNAEIFGTDGTSVQSGFRFRIGAIGTLSVLADNGAETQSSVTLSAAESLAGGEFIATAINGLSCTLYRKGALDAQMVTGEGTFSTLSAIAGRNVGWRIGAAYSGTSGTVRVGMVGMYSRALTASEIGQVYAVARARMAQRGVAI